ncbi:MAG: hypothetical protein QM767_27945 [Anaeromyxobacter sp.]
MTSCEALRRWIDEGRPAGDAGALLAHAAGCPGCAAELAAADALEAALRAPPPARAPAWILPAVMAEVSRAQARSRARRRRRAASPGALVAWSAVALAVGGAGWAAAALGGPALPPLPSIPALQPEALQGPAVAAALATVSLTASAGLTWLALWLTRAVEAAALRR